jgi:hypothetical protein
MSTQTWFDGRAGGPASIGAVATAMVAMGSTAKTC